MHFVYEAGPCGYKIQRHLSAHGFDCTIVAPSIIPKKKGNRIKNDRRDALELARLHRSDELTPIYVPMSEDEAMRDLTRAREDAKGDEKKCKQRLLAFLLRHGYKYAGRTPWSQAHWRWLADINMPHQSQQIVFQEYIDALRQCHQRVERLTNQSGKPIRQALRADIRTVQSSYGFTINGWFLMPEHMHCIWTLPPGDADFGKRWAMIKRFVTKQCGPQLHLEEFMNDSKRKRRESTIWQRRFWERQIRDEHDYKFHMNYLHYNPVKHGLVDAVKKWPYSTFHRYVKEGIYPQTWVGVANNDETYDVGEPLNGA